MTVIVFDDGGKTQGRRLCKRRACLRPWRWGLRPVSAGSRDVITIDSGFHCVRVGVRAPPLPTQLGMGSISGQSWLLATARSKGSSGALSPQPAPPSALPRRIGCKRKKPSKTKKMIPLTSCAPSKESCRVQRHTAAHERLPARIQQ